MRVRRCALCLILLVSHLLVGILVAVYHKSGDVSSYFEEFQKLPETKRKNLIGRMHLKTTHFNSPIIHERDCSGREDERGGDGAKPPINTTVFVITPTYKRLTQKVDLLTLCQALSLSRGRLKWIVVEDSKKPTPLVSALLSRCPVPSVHLSVRSQRRGGGKFRWFWRWFFKKSHRGVDQRNLALLWLRENYSTRNCSGGVVYFADDDNHYDYRLFDIMRKTIKVSVWPVGFAGALPYEGPVCFNDTVKKWKSWAVQFGPEREFPIDMAGFAVSLCLLFERLEAGFDSSWSGGRLEDEFLHQFVSKREEVECRGSDKEVYVWHVKTAKPSLTRGVKPEHLLET